MVPYIMTESSISVFLSGKMEVCDNQHINYQEVVEAVKRGADEDEILRLINVSMTITEAGNGEVEVIDGEIYYDGEVVTNALTNRILKMIEEGFDASPFISFMENLMANPYPRIREQLFTFLEKSTLPITEDGCFLAYKVVRNDYKDIHSNTMYNGIGTVVSMDQTKVDADPNHTCSSGLHFCSYSYLQSFGNGLSRTNLESEDHDRIMILKINPKNVGSIPVDYDSAKGRCWEYEVIGELAPQTLIDDFFVETGKYYQKDEVPCDDYEESHDPYDDDEDWDDIYDDDYEDEYFDPMY